MLRRRRRPEYAAFRLNTGVCRRFSEQFQLSGRLRGWCLLAPRDGDHVAELAVRNLYDGNEPLGRYGLAYPIYMNRAGFIAGAMPDIDGPLHHGEAVLNKILSESRGGLAVLFSFGGEIE